MADLRSLLEGVRSEFGTLTPRTVVDAARPVNSPLHSRFEWDDAVAGEAWRREQASALIRSVRVTYAEDKSGPKDVRAFVSVRSDESPHSATYIPTDEALLDDFTRRLVLAECEREIASLKSKYGHLKEFASLLARAAA
jgi:hypothetical protein